MYVYFIRQLETGFLKIGRANDPVRRLPNIQVGSPQELKLLGVAREVGSFKESIIHDAFQTHHYRGEWFHERDALAEAVKTRLEWFFEETRRIDRGAPLDAVEWGKKTKDLYKLARSDEQLPIYNYCKDCNSRKHYRHFYYRQKIPLSYCKPCQRIRSREQRIRLKAVATA